MELLFSKPTLVNALDLRIFHRKKRNCIVKYRKVPVGLNKRESHEAFRGWGGEG